MTMRRRKTRSSLIIGVMIAALAACGQRTPTSGIVVNKRYVQSYTYYTSVCVQYGSSGFCRLSIPMPMTVPDEYDLRVRGNSDDGKKTLTAWVPVDSASYSTFTIGDTWPVR